MKRGRQNLVFLAGNISTVNIRDSTTKVGEFFGSISVAYDDGYYDKDNNNVWKEDVGYYEIKLNNHVIQQVTSLNVGDSIEIQGKLITDRFKDKVTEKDRAVTKVRADRIIQHTTKQEIEHLKTLNN